MERSNQYPFNSQGTVNRGGITGMVMASGMQDVQMGEAGGSHLAGSSADAELEELCKALPGWHQQLSLQGNGAFFGGLARSVSAPSAFLPSGSRGALSTGAQCAAEGLSCLPPDPPQTQYAAEGSLPIYDELPSLQSQPLVVTRWLLPGRQPGLSGGSPLRQPGLSRFPLDDGGSSSSGPAPRAPPPDCRPPWPRGPQDAWTPALAPPGQHHQHQYQQQHSSAVLLPGGFYPTSAPACEPTDPGAHALAATPIHVPALVARQAWARDTPHSPLLHPDPSYPHPHQQQHHPHLSSPAAGTSDWPSGDRLLGGGSGAQLHLLSGASAASALSGPLCGPFLAARPTTSGGEHLGAAPPRSVPVAVSVADLDLERRLAAAAACPGDSSGRGPGRSPGELPLDHRGGLAGAGPWPLGNRSPVALSPPDAQQQAMAARGVQKMEPAGEGDAGFEIGPAGQEMEQDGGGDGIRGGGGGGGGGGSRGGRGGGARGCSGSGGVQSASSGSSMCAAINGALMAAALCDADGGGGAAAAGKGLQAAAAEGDTAAMAEDGDGDGYDDGDGDGDDRTSNGGRACGGRAGKAARRRCQGGEGDAAPGCDAGLGPGADDGLQLLAQRFRSRPGRVPKAVAKLGPIVELAKNAATGKIKLDKGELEDLVTTVETSLAKAVTEQKEDSRARNRVAQQRFRNRQRETIAALQAKVEEQEAIIAELEDKIRIYEVQAQRQQQQQLPLHPQQQLLPGYQQPKPEKQPEGGAAAALKGCRAARRLISE